MITTERHADTARRDLDALARLKGIQRRYVDGTGQRRHASDEAVMAVLRAMGTPIEQPPQARDRLRAIENETERPLCEPVIVIWRTPKAVLSLGPGCRDAGPIEAELNCEDGSHTSWNAPQGKTELSVGQDLPIGIHRLRVRCGAREDTGTVLVAPPRCHAPEQETAIGLFLPLYALRTDGNPGVGTLGELKELGRWAQGRGARLIGTLPLLSTFLDEPFEPSPYMPVSRSIFGELFVDLEDAAKRYELGDLKQLLGSPDWRAQAARLRGERLVDYRASWHIVRQGLGTATTEIYRKPGLRQQVESFAAADPLLTEYARFRKQHTIPGRHAQDEERLFLVAQWLLHDQLNRAARGLYLDLPIGSHRDGFDAWRYPDLYAKGISLGAPPDGLFQGGQSWGFPPVVPQSSRRVGHEEFAVAINRHLRHASALRIDHAAGLFRCFWVPDGMTASDGVYVHQPAEEYIALLSILSHRHQSTIIAENLGTVPREITRGLDRRGLLNMSILQFDLGDEEQPLPEPGTHTLTALNTHDMPTFAAHWEGSDIELHAKLGVVDPDDAPRLKGEREAMRQRVVAALRDRGLLSADNPQLLEVLEALLHLAADAHPSILLVNLEDLWGERAPQNVPGISEGFPNWRRKGARTLDEITSDNRLGKQLSQLSGIHAAKEK
ncbi:MAG: 4-alpha-glucanotransferase [Phycisphaerales bacterium]